MRKNFSCDSTQKWQCYLCTYLNWPKALRCVQCETPKEQSVTATEHQDNTSGSGTTTTAAMDYSADDSQENDNDTDLSNSLSSIAFGESDKASPKLQEFGYKKASSNSPLISSLYITEPSSSSREGKTTTTTCNTMLGEEEEDYDIDEESSVSALNNTLNTTNLLRNKKASSPLILDYDTKSVRNKQTQKINQLISKEILPKTDFSHHQPISTLSEQIQNYSKFQETYKNISEDQPRDKFSLGVQNSNMSSGNSVPEFSSTNYSSNDSLHSETNKHLISSAARPKSSLINSSSSQSITTNTNNRGTGSAYFSSKSSSSTPSNNGDKWTCGVCTYDNWPRSMKCVMCLTPRIHLDLTDPFRSRLKSSKEERVGFGSYNQNNDSAAFNQRDRDSELSNSNQREHSPISTHNNRISSVAIGNNGSPIVSNNRRTLDIDSRWLEACRGVVDGDIIPVEQFLAAGGDPARQLTQFEVAILNRPSAFDIGFTLIHLALRFHQENVLAVLLSQVDNQPTVVKRVPSYVAPDLAMDVRRLAMSSLRQRKGNFHCYYFTDVVTFLLPSEILDLRSDVQETLFDEILDRDVQKELESGEIINWSVELVGPLNSRLYALWNRSAGDCLLDSVLQGTWGIFDRDNGLRRALADSLQECTSMFYQRWKENELLHAHLMDFSLNDSQCATDWAKLLSIASKPGSSLEQLHIFALAHILRRPIIVYGVKYVKSFRGETLGFARYEGVYLPFLWDPSFCWKWPIALGYTRGHFSALVGLELDVQVTGASASKLENDHINRSIFLPLNSIDGTLLPIHFLSKSEIGKEEMILSQWLDVRFIESGVMVACQRIQKQPVLVSQMVDEWLNHYRRLGQITSNSFLHPPAATCYSSDESDD